MFFDRVYHNEKLILLNLHNEFRKITTTPNAGSTLALDNSLAQARCYIVAKNKRKAAQVHHGEVR